MSQRKTSGTLPERALPRGSSEKKTSRSGPKPSGGARVGSDAKKAAGTPGLRLLVLSGPNLHRLGKRQPEIYGHRTLDDIHALVRERAALRNADVECRQSNHEGELVEWIGNAASEGYAGILLNPGALTHTSYALYDALLGAEVPAVELHLSNPDAREAFRHHSTVAPACVGRIAGFGFHSYLLALDGLLDYLAAQKH